jgi:RNA polymerase sigma-70 factor (family 1)
LTGFADNGDFKWVQALKKGDARAFDKLFDLYGKRLFHFSLGYLKSKEEAEEVVQDVFLKIWNNRSTLKPELSFRSYLFTISYRHITEKFRKINRERQYLHEITETVVDFTDELDERSSYQSMLQLVEQLIEKLPARQREVLLMRKMEGIPVNEIAGKLGIAPKTVEQHYTQALKNLKTSLSRAEISGLLFFLLFIKG